MNWWHYNLKSLLWLIDLEESDNILETRIKKIFFNVEQYCVPLVLQANI